MGNLLRRLLSATLVVVVVLNFQNPLYADSDNLLAKVNLIYPNSNAEVISERFTQRDRQALFRFESTTAFESLLETLLAQFDVPKASFEYQKFILDLVTDYYTARMNGDYQREFHDVLVRYREPLLNLYTQFKTKKGSGFFSRFMGSKHPYQEHIEGSFVSILEVIEKPFVENNRFALLPQNVRSTLNDLNDMSDIRDHSEVAGLRKYNNPYIAEILIQRMYKEVSSQETNAILMESIVYVLLDYLNSDNFDKKVFYDLSREVYKTAELAEKKYADSAVTILPVIAQLTENVRKIPNYEVSSSKFSASADFDVPEVRNENIEKTMAKLKLFREHLEKNIIEQPEVIQALYDLEFETMVKGIGNNPEQAFFYLMGLPGVGKDTTMEVYVEALEILRGDEFLPVEPPKKKRQQVNGLLKPLRAEEHLFHIPVQKSKADAWAIFGSATGFKGSDDLSELLKFVVKHSGGKYKIERNAIFENEDWKPGLVLPGYYPPERGIISLNEFHDWSYDAKAAVVKVMLEKGYFPINNQNGGISMMQVKGFRFIAASNEGVELYTNRDVDGARLGEPLKYLEMMPRWERSANNPIVLKQSISKTALKNAPGAHSEEKRGMPEEMLNRIQSSRLLLMRPISEGGLKKVVRLRIERINKQLNQARDGVYSSFDLQVTENLVEFLQSYDYQAEDGARPIADKVRSMIESTLYKALESGSIKPSDISLGLTLDIKKNPDKTTSLVILKGTKTPTVVLAEPVIKDTLKEIDDKPISDEAIDRLADLPERLKERVVGADVAIEKISKAMLLSEEARYSRKLEWGDHQKATSFAFFGPSSTGKSEMAKALVKELFPEYGEQKRIDIDFNKIQNQYNMEEYIWGRKEGSRVIPSEFMKKYDQFDGDVLFVFEEATNAPKDLLRNLYDLFREAHPKFVDGKDRPMTKVTIILTGNAGLEWYTGVPKDLPEDVRMAAWARIYKRAMEEPGTTRQTLDKALPEPLTNRIGEQNIIWFAPHGFKSLRELTYIKINNYSDKLKASNGQRGWEVGFRSEADYERVVEIFEKEGFLLDEQGASLDRYIDQALNKDLRVLLLQNKVPSGSRVALAPRVDQSEEVIKKTKKVLLDVIVEGQSAPLVLTLDAKKREVFPRDNIVDTIMTGIHEAGHEFVGRLLLGDKHKSDFITIVPGVEEIQGQWIYYAGLRSAKEVERLVYNLEAVERTIAGLLAGEVAQDIFSKGNRYDAGKGNDIERATMIAERAVGEWGLSSVWGNRVVKRDQITTLSEADRNVFQAEVMKILNRSRNLAMNTILSNREVFSELAYELLVKGEIKSDGLEEYYKKNSSRIAAVEDQERFSENVDKNLFPPGYNDPNYKKSHNVEVADYFKVPPKIANINDIVEVQKNLERSQARRPKKSPLLARFDDKSEKPILVLAKDKVEQQERPDKEPPGSQCKPYFK